MSLRRDLLTSAPTTIVRMALAIAAVCALVAVPVSSAAVAPKAGDGCTPAQVGKKLGTLTCMKKGNLRVWEVLKTRTVTTTPSATAKPVATRAAASGPKGPIKLGIALGQSGSTTANLAQDQTLGVNLAEKYFNEKGGVNGRPIKLVIQDTTADETGAIAAFNALINSENVVGIVGPTLSQHAFAAGPIADRSKVPVLAPSATAAGIPQIGEYIARVSASPATSITHAMKFAAEQQPTGKAAVFFAQDDAFSRNETAIFQSVVKAAGIELLTPQTFNASETNFATQAAFVNANHPDLVAISGPASAGNLIRQLREIGFKGSIVGGNGLNVVQTFSVCKALCDGLILAQIYSPAIPGEGINLDFRKQFKLEHKRDPGQIAAQAFTAVQVFVEALSVIDKAGKLTDDIAATRFALNSQLLTGSYVTPLGEIAFDAEGEIIQKNFYIARVNMQRGDSADAFAGTFNYTKV